MPPSLLKALSGSTQRLAPALCHKSRTLRAGTQKQYFSQELQVSNRHVLHAACAMHRYRIASCERSPLTCWVSAAGGWYTRWPLKLAGSIAAAVSICAGGGGRLRPLLK